MNQLKKKKPLAIQQLTGEDLHYLNQVAIIFDDAPFWETIKQFTVLERLNRKTYNAHCLDFSDMAGKEVLEDALLESLAAEQIFTDKGHERLGRFFRFLTGQIEQRIYAVN